MSESLTYEELSLMAESVRIMTLELAIRFLNDYINGDTYFKTDYDKQNLYRTRAQIALVKDIESKLDLMDSYIKESYSEKYNGKYARVLKR
jgi:N-acetylhexosamine 1-kinase